MPWVARAVSTLCLAAGCPCIAALPLRIFSLEQGLAHEHVNRIYRDTNNFLWICTDGGFSRFDGQRFVNHTVASGLPHIHVNDILETRAGAYWIATDGGIARFHSDGRPQRFVTLVPPGPPGSRRVNALAEDSNGALWLGTSAGLYRLHSAGENVQIEREPVDFPQDIPEASTVTSLLLDRSGVLWAGSVSGIYRRNPNGTWSRFLVGRSPHIFVNSILEDPQGGLWICTRQHGFGRWAGSDGDSAILDPHLDLDTGLPDPDVRSLLFSSDGRRWAGTSSGLVDWSDPKHLKTWTTRAGLNDESIYALAEDPAGNLWIGTRRGGVMRMGSEDWTTFDRSSGLQLGPDEMLLQSGAGQICVADLSDGRRPLRCLSGDRFDEIVPALPRSARMAANSSEMVMQDRNGSWWISTGQGAFRFPANGAARDLALSHAVRVGPQVQTTRLFEDSRGDVWIATLSPKKSGLLRWKRSTGALHDESAALPSRLGDARISSFGEAPTGHLWIGLGHGGGLLRQRNGRFEMVPNALQGRISGLLTDHSGRLWIASLEGGLGRIDDPNAGNPSVQLLTASQGLANNEVWCVIEDSLGRIYAGHAAGVDRVDPKMGEILHYTAAEGLVRGDIRSCIRDRNGDLWFLSNRGTTRFRPALDLPLPTAHSRITAVRIAGEAWPVSELGETDIGPLQLSARQSSLLVEFGAIDYGAPPRLLYQYRLEGAPGDWSIPSPDRSVTFANLAPGRYRFVVRTVPAPGSSQAALTFTIQPLFWRRWWFQALLAFVIAAGIYAVHRTQLERKLALERVRSHIAMDLHDDLGASLARIAVLGEVMKSNVRQNDLESQLMLDDIAQTSRRLVEGMGDIVWSIDPRHDQAGDTIARLRVFASAILESRGIRWRLDAAPHLSNVKLSADQRRQLYLVCKEAIHNVARHSQAHNAAVCFGIDHGIFHAEIEDDGCGIHPGEGHGVGMRSMRARAAKLGGTLEVSAVPPQGTRVALRFPL